MRPIMPSFWPEIGAILQKNRGPTEIILHFFSCFLGFLGFFPLQAVDGQAQAAIRTLQKKSCLKTYRRFSVRSAMCHNRRMRVENNNWKTGRHAEKWRQKHGLLLSFCAKVAAASRRRRRQTGRGISAITGGFYTGNRSLSHPIASCVELRLIALNCT
jgi:hypothetical protein